MVETEEATNEGIQCVFSAKSCVQFGRMFLEGGPHSTPHNVYHAMHCLRYGRHVFVILGKGISFDGWLILSTKNEVIRSVTSFVGKDIAPFNVTMQPDLSIHPSSCPSTTK